MFKSKKRADFIVLKSAHSKTMRYVLTYQVEKYVHNQSILEPSSNIHETNRFGLDLILS